MDHLELHAWKLDYAETRLGNASLAWRVAVVLTAMPEEVCSDLLLDPAFQLALDTIEEGRGRQVWLAPPPVHARASRTVILRPRLAQCDLSFALYVIAHEFAHAVLWNGGWGEISDREDAADALAASWGFPRVPYR